jgi:hypothetical protein
MNHFDKLRPFVDYEFCDCKELSDLLLVYTLTDNPIHCFHCKGLLDPQRLGMSKDQIDLVSSWHRQFRALYDLWLDSGEYELWAKSQLLATNGQVNRAGLAATSSLTKLLPTYYWWFHDESDPVPQSCPVCYKALSPASRHGHGECLDCQIVI